MLEQMDFYMGKEMCFVLLGNNNKVFVKLLDNTTDYLVCRVKGFSNYYIINIMKNKIVSFYELDKKINNGVIQNN